MPTSLSFPRARWRDIELLSYWQGSDHSHVRRFRRTICPCMPACDGVPTLTTRAAEPSQARLSRDAARSDTAIAGERKTRGRYDRRTGGNSGTGPHGDARSPVFLAGSLVGRTPAALPPTGSRARGRKTRVITRRPRRPRRWRRWRRAGSSTSSTCPRRVPWGSRRERRLPMPSVCAPLEERCCAASAGTSMPTGFLERLGFTFSLARTPTPRSFLLCSFAAYWLWARPCDPHSDRRSRPDGSDRAGPRSLGPHRSDGRGGLAAR